MSVQLHIPLLHHLELAVPETSLAAAHGTADDERFSQASAGSLCRHDEQDLPLVTAKRSLEEVPDTMCLVRQRIGGQSPAGLALKLADDIVAAQPPPCGAGSCFSDRSQESAPGAGTGDETSARQQQHRRDTPPTPPFAGAAACFVPAPSPMQLLPVAALGPAGQGLATALSAGRSAELNGATAAATAAAVASRAAVAAPLAPLQLPYMPACLVHHPALVLPMLHNGGGGWPATSSGSDGESASSAATPCAAAATLLEKHHATAAGLPALFASSGSGTASAATASGTASAAEAPVPQRQRQRKRQRSQPAAAPPLFAAPASLFASPPGPATAAAQHNQQQQMGPPSSPLTPVKPSARSKPSSAAAAEGVEAHTSRAITTAAGFASSACSSPPSPSAAQPQTQTQHQPAGRRGRTGSVASKECVELALQSCDAIRGMEVCLKDGSAVKRYSGAGVRLCDNPLCTSEEGQRVANRRGRDYLDNKYEAVRICSSCYAYQRRLRKRIFGKGF